VENLQNPVGLTYRIPESDHWPQKWVNQIIPADALEALRALPDECIALIVTSPPYWNAVDYGGVNAQIGQTDYQTYIDAMVPIWREAQRALIPNGKLAIVTPVMPIAKSVIGNQHTRHLKNINNDIEYSILTGVPGLARFSLFIWQKQTTTKMFGSYPYPPNIYEDNTIEFINVFVKDGPPPPIPAGAKESSQITQEEWRNLTMQVWPIYPDDVKRTGGHPAPFPVVLPQRLIAMYTFKQTPEAGFAGDIVLDMFNGSGATCVAARAMGRNWIGIDLNPEYCAVARHRVVQEYVNPASILLERIVVKRATTPDQVRQLDLLPQELLSDDKLE
jgi:modification methylase